MKVFIVTQLESDGACGDPECCGEPTYSVAGVRAFTTKAKAEAFRKAQNYPWELNVHEVEIEK